MKFESMRFCQWTNMVFMFILLASMGWFSIVAFSTHHYGGSRGENHKPLGELIEGSVVQQTVPVKEVNYAGFLCYNVLFATYLRSNPALLIISLIQDNFRQSFNLDASKLTDNHTYPLCFQATGFTEGNAVLEIAGLNGKPGQSPTVWLTTDTTYGEAVSYGKPVKGSLVFQAYVKKHIVFSWVLAGVAVVLFSLLFLIPAIKNLFYRYYNESISPHSFSDEVTRSDNRWLYLIFSMVAFTLIMVMATTSRFSVHNAHPDEALHSAAATYYETYSIPPAVGDPRSNFTYKATPYGVSYINQTGIDYFLTGKFSLFIKSVFSTDHLHTQRFFNVFLFFCLCLIVFYSGKFLVFFPFIITPQVWYVASYINNDFFPFFIMTILCLEFLNRKSFYSRSLVVGSPIALALPAGILLGVLLISKANYLIFVFFVIFYLFWNTIRINQFQLNRALFYGRAFQVTLLILLCAASVYGVRLGFDLYQNGFDKNQKLQQMGNRFGATGFRPLDIENNLRQTRGSLRLKDKGESVTNLLAIRNWHNLSKNSFFGVYGRMNIKAPDFYYQYMFFLFCLLVAYAGAQLIVTFQAGNIIFFMGSCFFISAMILTSLYHSWTYDFQPQGRYLFPLLGILPFLLHEARAYLNQYILRLLISLMFVFSFWSFLFVGIYYMKN